MTRAARKNEGWRCPRCGRRFLHSTREHSCDVRSLASHLDRATPEVKETVGVVQDVLSAVGPHRIVPVKTMILLRTTSNFGGIVVRRDSIDLGFFLNRALSHARIYKTERIGPRKYAHHVRLSSPVEVDSEIIAWLQEAYHSTMRRS